MSIVPPSCAWCWASAGCIGDLDEFGLEYMGCRFNEREEGACWWAFNSECLSHRTCTPAWLDLPICHFIYILVSSFAVVEVLSTRTNGFSDQFELAQHSLVYRYYVTQFKHFPSLSLIVLVDLVFVFSFCDHTLPLLTRRSDLSNCPPQETISWGETPNLSLSSNSNMLSQTSGSCE